MEIDRIDTETGYVPGNIRFVTKRKNQHNRRDVTIIIESADKVWTDLPSGEYAIAELLSWFSKHKNKKGEYAVNNVTAKAVHNRYHVYNWTAYDSLFAPKTEGLGQWLK